MSTSVQSSMIKFPFLITSLSCSAIGRFDSSNINNNNNNNSNNIDFISILTDRSHSNLLYSDAQIRSVGGFEIMDPTEYSTMR